MAQWKGQFSGVTHATKVRDLESTLSVAVKAVQTAPKAEVTKKLRAALRIAERLLSARLHMLRDRISAASEKDNGSDIATLRLREQSARVGGAEAILREFSAGELIGPAEPAVPADRGEGRRSR